MNDNFWEQTKSIFIGVLKKYEQNGLFMNNKQTKLKKPNAPISNKDSIVKKSGAYPALLCQPAPSFSQRRTRQSFKKRRRRGGVIECVRGVGNCVKGEILGGTRVFE